MQYKKLCVEMMKQLEDSHSLNQTIIELNEELLKENRKVIDSNSELVAMLKLRIEKLEKDIQFVISLNDGLVKELRIKVPETPTTPYGTGYWNPHQPWTAIISDSSVQASDYTHV